MSKEFYGSEGEQDVPDIQTGLTSSVGALWPPGRASFEREKGIYTPAVVRSSLHMGVILGEIDRAVASFRGDGITRVSYRAVIDSAYLAAAREQNPYIDSLIEAQFSLNGTQPAFESTSLVYLGANHESRQPLEIPRLVRNVEDAFQCEPIPPSEILGRATDQGYDLSVLTNDIPKVTVDQVSALYERFEWTRDEVVEILTKPTNLVAVASKDGEIVSAGIAEMVSVPIGGDTLRIVEITEAATREDHARKGLYTAVSTRLLLDLAQRSQRLEVLGGSIDLVYGECNGNAPGVLKTARLQGRRFAFEYGPDGVLFQHVPIKGVEKITRYNDLFPTAINTAELHRRYGNVRD